MLELVSQNQLESPSFLCCHVRVVRVSSVATFGQSEFPSVAMLGQSEFPSVAMLGPAEFPYVAMLGQSEFPSVAMLGQSEFPSVATLELVGQRWRPLFGAFARTVI